MRAEIALLERNIEINASIDDIGYILDDVWGCRILVADFIEADRSYRAGNLILDGVSVYNCSQKMTYKSAIKWE